MKAILIRQDGFKKQMNVEGRVPYIANLATSSVNFKPISEELLQDIQIPVSKFELDRSFVNEDNEEILIYRELP